MARPTAVILCVGLNQDLLRHAPPRLTEFVRDGQLRRLVPVLPAVTCSVQSSMLTGLPPSGHGIVGNGWFNREMAEVQFWKQSNRLVHGPRVWELARDREPSLTCAKLFWWFNMYASADISVTPRPMYKADGRKLPDIYTEPPKLRETLQESLGQFPLFQFWGPGASIRSTDWIARCAVDVHRLHRPTLSLVYLPHLDYALQQHGPDSPQAREAIHELDASVALLLDYYASAGVQPLIVSEYGIEPVDTPIHINRELREAGWLRVRSEDGLELLDPGASEAFAVADHQVAHVYVRNPALLSQVRNRLERLVGVDAVLHGSSLDEAGLRHERAGDLVVVAESGAWFTYYYWMEDAHAPDFARTVDIHRKPGYDPAELFLNPHITCPKLAIARRLIARKLGFRRLMDVIGLDAGVVRGSHGRVAQPAAYQPVIISGRELPDGPLPCTDVCSIILEHLFG